MTLILPEGVLGEVANWLSGTAEMFEFAFDPFILIVNLNHDNQRDDRDSQVQDS